MRRTACHPNVEILFNHEVVDPSQTEDSVSVRVRSADGITTHDCSYVIGAAGARSTVRKHTGIAFDGFTW